MPLNEERPSDRELGPLRFAGGWVLTSDDRRFGALSSIRIEGGIATALGDHGILFRFAVPPEGTGKVAIVPLRDGPGDARSKIDRDSEALAVADGAIWVGYENSNQIWRYRTGDWSPAARAAPEAMKSWSANRGAESLLRLPGGRFLAISEDLHEDVRLSDAVLFDGDPSVEGTRGTPLRLRPPAGHRITDAALLDEERLLLLSRGFTIRQGWSAKLLVARLPRSGSDIRLWEVATLAAPFTVDNMEALAVTRAGARTFVWLASDDNLIPLQSTLLMKFEVIG